MATREPEVVVGWISYDGPSIFLQGQNNFPMQVMGMVTSPIPLHQVSFDIQVFGTFIELEDQPTVAMSLQDEPLLTLIPDPDVADPDVASEYIYKIRATLLSNFSTPHSGACRLVAALVFGPSMTMDDVFLRFVSVISHEDQDNYETRRIVRRVHPLPSPPTTVSGMSSELDNPDIDMAEFNSSEYDSGLTDFYAREEAYNAELANGR